MLSAKEGRNKIPSGHKENQEPEDSFKSNISIMAFIVYGLNTPMQRKIVRLVLVMIRTEIIYEYIDKLKMKGWEKIDKANTNHKRAILTADKVGFKKTSIIRITEEEHLTMINYFPKSKFM